MRFTLRRPCPECPFSTRSHPYLSEARALEIAGYVLEEGRTFTCHKHLNGGYIYDDDGQGRYVADASDQHCAGAIAMVEKVGRPNQMLQIAERLGLRDADQLDPACLDEVFDSAGAMARHHRG